MSDSYRVARLDELDRISVAGVTWRPLRRRLGTRAFGVNAYTANAGEELIEAHDETGSGAGAHEELYIVMSGHADFTVAGDEIDAPAGTFVFVSDLEAKRHAVARVDGTTVVVVGGPPRNAIPVSPWEYYFAAEPAYRAGDYARAVEIAAEGLEEWPDHGSLHYQLACYQSLAGNRDVALDHLRRAIDADPRTREWAAKDSDFDAIRDAADFPR